MAANMATVTAAGSSGTIRSGRASGKEMCGKPFGMPPNLLPMVSTGTPKTATASVEITRATIEPGTRFVSFGNSRMMRSEPMASRTADQRTLPRLSTRRRMRNRNSLGTVPVSRPRKSLICVEAIKTAIPFVKPIVTGRGIYFTAEPKPVTAMSKRITPAMIVMINRPGTPCVATIPATITTKAPVGPPI